MDKCDIRAPRNVRSAASWRSVLNEAALVRVWERVPSRDLPQALFDVAMYLTPLFAYSPKEPPQGSDEAEMVIRQVMLKTCSYFREKYWNVIVQVDELSEQEIDALSALKHRIADGTVTEHSRKASRKKQQEEKGEAR